MASHIPEPDWRLFKEIHGKLLERYCSRILQEVAIASRSTEGTAHDQYLKIYELIQDHDKQIGHAFSDFRRSTAVLQLAIMRRMKLLTNEDLRRFSAQTRTRIEDIASL